MLGFIMPPIVALPIIVFLWLVWLAFSSRNGFQELTKRVSTLEAEFSRLNFQIRPGPESTAVQIPSVASSSEAIPPATAS
jgi:hypothetical protein